jgi:hypothetical protein
MKNTIEKIKAILNYYNIPFHEIIITDDYIHYDGAVQACTLVHLKNDVDIRFAQETINKQLKMGIEGKTSTSFLVLDNEVVKYKMGISKC